MRADVERALFAVTKAAAMVTISVVS